MSLNLQRRIVIVVLMIGAWAQSATAQVSVPNTFSAGNTISAVQMNSNFTTVVNALNNLQAQVTALQNQKVAFRVGLISNQRIQDNAAHQVAFADESLNGGFDIGAGFDPATHKFKAPSAGTYVFVAHVQPYNLSQEYGVGLDIRKNGSSLNYSSMAQDSVAPSSLQVIVLDLAKDDLIDVWINSSDNDYTLYSTTDFTTSPSYFTGFKIN